jgi:hypothetical protein
METAGLADAYAGERCQYFGQHVNDAGVPLSIGQLLRGTRRPDRIIASWSGEFARFALIRALPQVPLTPRRPRRRSH